MKKHVEISIIVPIYNIEEKYLKKCIESLMEQTFVDIEILLINDGSTNNSLVVCEEYAKKDIRIKVFDKKNEGVSSARNLGIDNANAPYIMFVDGDDWLDAKCCEESYEQIKKGFDIVSWSYNKEYESGKIEKIEIFNEDKICNDDIREFDYYDMKILGSSCMKLYSKQIIEKDRFNQDLINGEDVEFNFRIFKKIKSIKFINKNYYNYVIRKDSSVRKYNENMLENYNKTLNIIRKEIDNNDEKQVKAYFSFVAISFLMICLNFIFTNKIKIKYNKKIKLIKEVLKIDVFKSMLGNLNKINLPITRKFPIIFAKYKCYFLVGIIMKIKQNIT